MNASFGTAPDAAPDTAPGVPEDQRATSGIAFLRDAVNRVPLWREALARGLGGVRREELEFPMEPPEAFDVAGFALPAALSPLFFEPKRFVRGRLRSLLLTLGRTPRTR